MKDLFLFDFIHYEKTKNKLILSKIGSKTIKTIK